MRRGSEADGLGEEERDLRMCAQANCRWSGAQRGKCLIEDRTSLRYQMQTLDLARAKRKRLEPERRSGTAVGSHGLFAICYTVN